MNWKVWLHSLLSAAIGGASSALGAAIVAPSTFNLTHDGLVALGKIALFGAVTPVLALLKQSPLPKIAYLDSATKKVTTAILLAALGLAAVATVSGCTDWERSAYQTLAASKAAIDQAQADYESGKLPHSSTVYAAINKAKATQTAAVNALLVFEQLKANHATSDKLNEAQADVVTILGELPTILATIKTLY